MLQQQQQFAAQRMAEAHNRMQEHQALASVHAQGQHVSLL